MAIVTPVLLSVVKNSDGTVTFAWQPWSDPSMVSEVWGDVQGFDDRGYHVIGAMVDDAHLSAGNATVPLYEKRKHATVSCQLFVNGRDSSGTLSTAGSNTVTLSLR